MGFLLRAGLSFCIAGRRAAFLDLPANRYFCLPPAADAAFRALVAGDGVSAEHAAALDALVHDRLIERSATAARPVACSVAAPQSEFHGTAGALARLRHLPGAIAAIAGATAGVRARRLPSLLDALARSKVAGAPGARCGGPMPDALVAAFDMSAMLFGRHDQCLARSIALAGALLRAGVVPQLVLGVMMRPFAAHCWVQVDTMVLGDRVETVYPFTPILAV
jgi:hypothetical protein